MKNKYLLFLWLLIVTMTGLYSCRKEAEKKAALPTVTITRSNSNSPVPGEKVTFNIAVTADAFLREVKVGEEIIKTYDYKHMQTSDNFTYDWVVPAEAVAGDTAILFEVSDKQAIPKVTRAAPVKVTIVVPNIPLPTITVTRSGTEAKLPGEKVTFDITVAAAGNLRNVKLNGVVIKTYEETKNADQFQYEWMVPVDVAKDQDVVFTVSDQRPAPKSAKATITVPVIGCVNFDETAAITGTGKTGITDFSSLTAERLQNFIVASETDKVQPGVDNPRGCGKVLLFDKAPNIGWGGWNGFQLLVTPFSATEFTSFARKTGSKVLKVDVYRDNTKAGAGDVPPEGLVIYVTLGNLAKLNAGPKPLGRGQFFKGLITASNTWQTITFTIDAAGPALDNTLGNNESDMLEFVPGIDVEADGGRYYFDNLRIENR